MSYLKRGIKSFNLLKKNLVLFAPGLLNFGILLLLSLILLKITGLLSIIWENYQDIESLKTQLQLIITNIPILIKLIIFIVIFILVNFVIGTFLITVKYDMIANLLKNKKISFKESFSNAKNYFLNIVGIKIIIYLVIFIPLTLAILIQLLSQLKILFIILICLVFLFYIYLIFALLFVYPSIFLKTKKVFPAIKESFSFFSKNKKHTIFTFLIIILVSLVISNLIATLQYITSLSPQSILIPILILIYIINLLINQALGIWKNLFIFTNYLKKN